MANIFDIQLPDGTKYNFADARIPVATSSDANKVITVDSSGNYVLGTAGSSTDTKVTQVADNSNSDRPILVAYDTQSNVSTDVTNTVKKSSGKQFTFNTNTGAFKLDKAQMQYNTTTNSLDFTFL